MSVCLCLLLHVYCLCLLDLQIECILYNTIHWSTRLERELYNTIHSICRSMYCIIQYTQSVNVLYYDEGSLKFQDSFAKEPYKTDDILQKRPMNFKESTNTNTNTMADIMDRGIDRAKNGEWIWRLIARCVMQCMVCCDRIQQHKKLYVSCAKIIRLFCKRAL